MRSEIVIMIAAASLVIGLSKGGFGPILGALATPLLSQVMPVSDAAAVALPLLLMGDIFALRVYWHLWDMRHIRLLVPAAALGVLVGTYLLTTLPDTALRVSLGLFTLLAVAYKLNSGRLAESEYHLRNWHGYVAGAASGFGSAVANAGGPPFTAYMLLQDTAPETFMATTSLFFATVNLIKLPGFVLAGLMDHTPLGTVILVLPLVLVGIWLGQRFITWISPRAFELFMIALLIASSVLLFLPPL